MIAKIIFVMAAIALLVAPTLHMRRKGYAVFRADRRQGTGVYGWLLLFVVYALYVGPFFVLILALTANPAELSALLASAFRGESYAFYLAAVLAGMLASLLLAVRAGMLAVMRAPNAPRRIRMLLAGRVVIDIACCCALPFLLLPRPMAAAAVNGSVTSALASVCIQAAWSWYFAKSRQVARTFTA